VFLQPSRLFIAAVGADCFSQPDAHIMRTLAFAFPVLHDEEEAQTEVSTFLRQVFS